MLARNRQLCCKRMPTLAWEGIHSTSDDAADEPISRLVGQTYNIPESRVRDEECLVGHPEEDDMIGFKGGRGTKEGGGWRYPCHTWDGRDTGKKRQKKERERVAVCVIICISSPSPALPVRGYIAMGFSSLLYWTSPSTSRKASSPWSNIYTILIDDSFHDGIRFFFSCPLPIYVHLVVKNNTPRAKQVEPPPKSGEVEFLGNHWEKQPDRHVFLPCCARTPPQRERKRSARLLARAAADGWALAKCFA